MENVKVTLWRCPKKHKVIVIDVDILAGQRSGDNTARLYGQHTRLH